MIVEACPGCGGTDASSGGTRAGQVVAVVDGRAFAQPDYYVRHCDHCGLCFKSDVLTWSELRDYYARVDFTKWEIDGLFPTERAVLRVLRGLPQQARILDYGCSTGRLLRELCQEYKCFGVELNEKAAGIAAAHGLTMLDESELERNEFGFDAIVLSDVFEHLPEPTNTLKRLFGQVAIGGLLILTTGNADAEACRRDIANFWYMRNVEHLCMLGRKYVEYLSQQLHAEILAWTSLCHYDYSLARKTLEWSRNFAYWAFHGRSRILPALLRFMPFFGRARQWPVPPSYSASQDHVMVVLRKICTNAGAQ